MDTKIRTWIIWALSLFTLVVAADYYFLHLLFSDQAVATPQQTLSQNAPLSLSDDSFIDARSKVSSPDSERDNFLENLKKCAPEIAAQAIATPEALVIYLQKSIGAEKELITLENYHLRNIDGSNERLHVISGDITANNKKISFRNFKYSEGANFSEIPVSADAKLEDLLKDKTVLHHDIRAEIKLVDKTTLLLEKRDNVVTSLQYNNHTNTLACYKTSCICN